MSGRSLMDRSVPSDIKTLKCTKSFIFEQPVAITNNGL